MVVAERCLVDCWLARAPPPSSGAPPPAWASQEALPATLGRLTGRAVLVLPEPSDADPGDPLLGQSKAKDEGRLAATF